MSFPVVNISCNDSFGMILLDEVLFNHFCYVCLSVYRIIKAVLLHLEQILIYFRLKKTKYVIPSIPKELC